MLAITPLLCSYLPLKEKQTWAHSQNTFGTTGFFQKTD